MASWGVRLTWFDCKYVNKLSLACAPCNVIFLNFFFFFSGVNGFFEIFLLYKFIKTARGKIRLIAEI